MVFRKFLLLIPHMIKQEFWKITEAQNLLREEKKITGGKWMRKQKRENGRVPGKVQSKAQSKSQQGNRKSNSRSTIFDNVLRTAQERHGQMLIPVVNETFHENYPWNTPVRRLPDDYRQIVSKVVADACNVIGDRVYHVECQARDDKTMILRMVEYDFMIGMYGAEVEEGLYRLRFPRSCIIYLRHDGEAPEGEEMELVFQDGQTVRYQVPTVRVQSYTLDGIFEKKLYLFLPFYILRYEKELDDIDSDEERREAVLVEYGNILDRLEEALRDEPDVYQDLLQLMYNVLEYVLRDHEEFKEEVGSVMGGRVLPLPSDRLREERAEGKVEKLVSQVCRKLRKGKAVEVIADELEEDIEEIQSICVAAEAFAPDYDEEQVFHKLMEMRGKASGNENV